MMKNNNNKFYKKKNYELKFLLIVYILITFFSWLDGLDF